MCLMKFAGQLVEMYFKAVTLLFVALMALSKGGPEDDDKLHKLLGTLTGDEELIMNECLKRNNIEIKDMKADPKESSELQYCAAKCFWGHLGVIRHDGSLDEAFIQGYTRTSDLPRSLKKNFSDCLSSIRIKSCLDFKKIFHCEYGSHDSIH